MIKLKATNETTLRAFVLEKGDSSKTRKKVELGDITKEQFINDLKKSSRKIEKPKSLKSEPKRK